MKKVTIINIKTQKETQGYLILLSSDFIKIKTKGRNPKIKKFKINKNNSINWYWNINKMDKISAVGLDDTAQFLELYAMNTKDQEQARKCNSEAQKIYQTIREGRY